MSREGARVARWLLDPRTDARERIAIIRLLAILAVTKALLMPDRPLHNRRDRSDVYHTITSRE